MFGSYFMEEFFETIKFIIPCYFVGVIYWCPVWSKQIKIGKRLDFIEKQLREFYSPLQAQMIRAKSELTKSRNISGRQWKENAAKGVTQSVEFVDKKLSTITSNSTKIFCLCIVRC